MRFSIIIPVLNEEIILEQQLNTLIHQCAHHDCELLIVDGGSADRTLEVAQHFGEVITSRRGRAIQMNAGASVATGRFYFSYMQIRCSQRMHSRQLSMHWQRKR